MVLDPTTFEIGKNRIEALSVGVGYAVAFRQARHAYIDSQWQTYQRRHHLSDHPLGRRHRGK
jgi:hypothetical protein